MTKYTFGGPKNPTYDNTEVLDLGEGRDAVTVGGEVELSDDEHKALSKTLKLRKAGDSDESDSDDASNTNQNSPSSDTVVSTSSARTVGN